MDDVERVARALLGCMVDLYAEECDEGQTWNDLKPHAKDELHSLARAALAAMGPVWRPIESAPKDGTRILLSGGRMFCEAIGNYVTEPLSAQWDVHGQWLVAGTEGGYVISVVDDPNHWMPLPAAPQEGDA